jgi:hypothetical protein
MGKRANSKPEEPEFHLDVTAEHAPKESEWEWWDVFPNQKRLTHQYGWRELELSIDEVYEYAVRHTSVFVRLLEKSAEGVDGHVYEVFGGSVNTARLEEDYEKKIKKYENDVNKDLFLHNTPAIISARLQREIVWHEIYGAVRYFILAKDVPVVYVADFVREELERFTNAFAAIEKKAEELGAAWSDFGYKAPEHMPLEAKEEIEKQLEVFKFGFRNIGEFLQKDTILGVLKDALGEKK